MAIKEPKAPRTPRAQRTPTGSAAQLIVGMMNDTQVGGLKEIFILEAIRAYSSTQLEPKAPWPDASIISQKAWRAAAQECLTTINAQR